MDFKEALSIKGKIAYAEGQLFGRVAARACRLLSFWASGGDDKRITEEVRDSLSSVMGALRGAGPRVISFSGEEKPIVVFIDGACEEDCTSIGGILFEHGKRPQAFGAVMAKWVVREWATKEDQSQVICQAEIFPTLVARHTWKERLRGKRVLYFIDNDSARLALIKSYSPVLSSLRIIEQCAVWDCKENCTSWFARVPTGANCADGPSRMLTDVVDDYGAEIIQPLLPDSRVWTTDVLGFGHARIHDSD